MAYWKNAELYKQSLQSDLDIDQTDKYKTEFVTIKSVDGTNLRLVILYRLMDMTEFICLECRSD